MSNKKEKYQVFLIQLNKNRFKRKKLFFITLSIDVGKERTKNTSDILRA